MYSSSLSFYICYDRKTSLLYIRTMGDLEIILGGIFLSQFCGLREIEGGRAMVWVGLLGFVAGLLQSRFGLGFYS